MSLIIKLLIGLVVLFLGKELIATFGLADPAPKIIWIILVVFVVLCIMGYGYYF